MPACLRAYVIHGFFLFYLCIYFSHDPSSDSTNTRSRNDKCVRWLNGRTYKNLTTSVTLTALAREREVERKR